PGGPVGTVARRLLHPQGLQGLVAHTPSGRSGGGDAHRSTRLRDAYTGGGGPQPPPQGSPRAARTGTHALEIEAVELELDRSSGHRKLAEDAEDLADRSRLAVERCPLFSEGFDGVIVVFDDD